MDDTQEKKPKFKVGQEVEWTGGLKILDIKYVKDDSYYISESERGVGRYMYLVRYLNGQGFYGLDWFYEMELKEVEEEK
jgi:hypothetical protein